jgi:hypothetical protein
MSRLRLDEPFFVNYPAIAAVIFPDSRHPMAENHDVNRIFTASRASGAISPIFPHLSRYIPITRRFFGWNFK